MQRDHSKVFHSGFEADNVTAKSCIPMHPSIPKWATAANMILILTITKQHYTWSLSTGPLTKESRMFSDTKAARDKGDQNYDYINWIIKWHCILRYFELKLMPTK